MTYQEIKTKHEKEVNDLITKYQVFFAFSQSQLEEGKAKINIVNNSDLTSIGAGGFMPKAQAGAFLDAMELADKNYKQELKDAKEEKEKAILYELNNHECFYCGNIDPVFDFFDGVYTKDEIKAVYKKFYSQEKKYIDKTND